MLIRRAALAFVLVTALVLGVALVTVNRDHPPHTRRVAHVERVPLVSESIATAVHDQQVKRLLTTAYLTPPPVKIIPPKIVEQQPPTSSEYAPPEYLPSDSPCGYADLIRSVWSQDAEWAIGIAYRESRCQAGAANSEGASGLFQLMLPMHNDLLTSVGCVPSQWSDPSCNVRAAYALYQGSGRSPWSL